MFTRILAALLFAATHGPAAIAQSCQPYWAGIGSPINARSLVVFDDGSGPELYASSVWLVGTGPPLARWNGQRWQALTSGMPPLQQVGSLRVFNDGTGDGLYIVVLPWPSPPLGWTLMRWSASEWVPANPGFGGEAGWPVITIATPSGPMTYGGRAVPGNSHQNVVVRWTGASWVTIGTPDLYVVRMAAYDDGSGPQLHVAGVFNHISGTPVQNIAKWDGSSWHPMGSGVTWAGGPRDLTVHNDGSGPGLYVADVLTAGGQPVNRIAKWNGQAWSDVGGGGIMSVGITTLHILGSFDDGTGPALFAGGYMQMAGGNVPVRSIARYKGGVWDDMLGGVHGGIPWAMAVYDDGRGPSLFVGGEFGTVGAGPWPVPPGQGSALGIAQWVGCQNQCYADCDNSQVAPRLNVEDFSCFIQKFAYGDPYVDCNQDGIRDVQDFHCFIQRFMENCR
jgi:hypothetical protein